MPSTIVVPSGTNGTYPPGIEADLIAVAAAAKADIDAIQTGSTGTPGAPSLQTGTVVLGEGGRVTVPNVRLSKTSIVLHALNTVSGTPGELSAPAANRTATSFDLVSGDPLDRSAVDWMIA